MSYILLIRKVSKREKEQVIHFSALLPCAHTNLWSTLPCRAMLAVMVKHAPALEPCPLLGQPRLTRVEMHPPVSGHGMGSGVARVCTSPCGGRGMLHVMCLCKPLSGLRKGGRVARTISQALKRQQAPPLGSPWPPRCPLGTIWGWPLCQAGAAPLLHCRNIYLILQHCFQDD